MGFTQFLVGDIIIAVSPVVLAAVVVMLSLVLR